MGKLTRYSIAGLVVAIGASSALAGPDDFVNGPVFSEFGPNAAIVGATAIPAETEFKIAFDTSKAAETGKINRTVESAARFINMHVRAGVPKDQIELAVVIHGKAVKDVIAPADGSDALPSVAAINALLEHKVRIIVCGQSAAYYDVKTKDLLPGVEMALSAMTTHAILQQDGYTLNPF